MASHIEVIAELRDLISGPANDATRQIEGLHREVQDLTQEFINGTIPAEEYARRLRNIERRARFAGAQADRFRREVLRLERGQRGAERGGRQWDRTLQKVTRTLRMASGAVGVLAKGLIMLSFISPAIATVTAMGGAAVALGAGAVVAGGALAALPAFALAAGSAIKGLSFAFSSVQDALAVLRNPEATIEEINAAMRDLSPEAKEFVGILSEMDSGWRDIRDSYQRAIYPMLGGSLRTLYDGYLPLLERAAVGVADALGKVSVSFAEVMDTDMMKGRVGRIFDTNEVMVGQFGRTVTSVFTGWIGVMDAARPMAVKFGSAIERIAINWSRWTNSTEGQAGMTTFFEKTYTYVMGIARFFRDIGIGIWNIGKIALGLGESIGGTLGTIAANFRAWTESGPGQERIKQFFSDIKPLVDAVGRLIAALFGNVIEIGVDTNNIDTAVIVVDKLTEAVPDLKDFINALIALVPAVVTVVGWIASVLGWFGRLPEPIQKAILIIGAIIAVIIWLAGVLAPVITVGVALAGVVTAAGVAIGFLIAAAVILIAGLVTLYVKSERFRDIVNTVAKAVWEFGKYVLDFLLAPIRLVIDAVKSLIDWFGKLKFPDIGIPSWVENGLGIGNGVDDWGWGREKGGPVWEGKTFLTGEAGPELFLGRSGKVELLGAQGPETRRFSESGMVIPNRVTERVMASSGAARRGVPQPSSPEMEAYGPMPPIHVHNHGSTEYDMKRALREGIEQWHREQRERKYR